MVIVAFAQSTPRTLTGVGALPVPLGVPFGDADRERVGGPGGVEGDVVAGVGGVAGMGETLTDGVGVGPMTGGSRSGSGPGPVITAMPPAMTATTAAKDSITFVVVRRRARPTITLAEGAVNERWPVSAYDRSMKPVTSSRPGSGSAGVTT
ncbi:hypothetical protein ACQPYV_20270 [Micromonospora saelicesensis]|uniref:hypothetical protein n=1 Tax=Micromonospora saelicesensis TaxID=285676 RepID=UPI003D94A054